MPLSFNSDLMATYYEANVANDPNYEAPGNYNISTAASGSVGVASVTVNTPGTYTVVPAATAATGLATFQTQMSFRSASTIAAAGTIYAPGNTIHLTGGTAITPVTLTVATVKLVSATIAAGGAGYGNAQTFNVTVAGGTSSSAAVVNVTTSAGGAVTTINSVTTPGSYTVLPSLAANAVTGDDGSDHGTGLTLNLVFGVLTFTVANAGLYTALPANPIATTVTSGSGTGLTLTGSWQVQAVAVVSAGDYPLGVAPVVNFASGSAAATAVLASQSATQTDEQKVLLMIEIMRSFIAEADTVQQLRDMKEIMRKMMALLHFGGNTSAQGVVNHFSAATTAQHALNAGMGYFARSPKRQKIVL